MTEFINAIKDDEVVDEMLKTMTKLDRIFHYMEIYGENLTEDTVEYASNIVMKDCYDILIERVEELIEKHDI